MGYRNFNIRACNYTHGGWGCVNTTFFDQEKVTTFFLVLLTGFLLFSFAIYTVVSPVSKGAR